MVHGSTAATGFDQQTNSAGVPQRESIQVTAPPTGGTPSPDLPVRVRTRWSVLEGGMSQQYSLTGLRNASPKLLSKRWHVTKQYLFTCKHTCSLVTTLHDVSYSCTNISMNLELKLHRIHGWLHCSISTYLLLFFKHS